MRIWSTEEASALGSLMLSALRMKTKKHHKDQRYIGASKTDNYSCKLKV